MERRSARPGWGVRALLGAHMLLLAPVVLRAFGGEDPVTGDPWYHKELTYTAATRAGFGKDAASALAFHSDSVDSYAYNPLWWAGGGYARLQVAMATHKELDKLHFDNLSNATAIQAMWRRLFYGNLAGLLWACDHNDVPAAHNVIGATLHAVQDFSSHSSWVDDTNRRETTWFELSPDVRSQLPNLYTGTYSDDQLLDQQSGGVKPHGKYYPAAALLHLPAVSTIMEVLCHAASPLGNVLGELWRKGKDAVSVRPATVGTIKVPENALYMQAGIALDNTWTASIGVKERGLQDAPDPVVLFNQACVLASRTSEQWLTLLGQVMAQAGTRQKAFWNQVCTWEYNPKMKDTRQAWYSYTGTTLIEKLKGPTPPQEWLNQYEQFDRFPFMFSTVGEEKELTPGYFLRITLKTADEPRAGTDATIGVVVDGKEPAHPLDYMRFSEAEKNHPAIARNDFERGSQAAYMLGPFAHLPRRITLKNSGTIDELLRTAAQAAFEHLKNTWEQFVSVAKSLRGGHADIVGSDKIIWEPGDLERLTDSRGTLRLEVDQGSHGHYTIDGSITRVATPGSTPSFQVSLDTMTCVRESAWDRGTSQDEPFVLALLTVMPGKTLPYKSDVYTGVDSTEVIANLKHTFEPVEVPAKYGALALLVVIMESDDESEEDRRRLLDDLQRTKERITNPAGRALFDQVGALIAPDWKLEEIEVYGFGREVAVRGSTGVVAGVMYKERVNTWIPAGGEYTIAFGDRPLSNEVAFDIDKVHLHRDRPAASPPASTVAAALDTAGLPAFQPSVPFSGPGCADPLLAHIPLKSGDQDSPLGTTLRGGNPLIGPDGRPAPALIAALQAQLRLLGFGTGTRESGRYDTATTHAVREFQRQALTKGRARNGRLVDEGEIKVVPGLIPSGEVDQATLDEMLLWRSRGYRAPLSFYIVYPDKRRKNDVGYPDAGNLGCRVFAVSTGSSGEQITPIGQVCAWPDSDLNKTLYGLSNLAGQLVAETIADARFPGATWEKRAICAVVANEARVFEAINSWDAAFLSAGIFQWTSGTGDGGGELPGLVATLTPADQGRLLGPYGLRAIPEANNPPGRPQGRWELDQKPMVAITKAELRGFRWAYRFIQICRDPAFQLAQYRSAHDRIARLLGLTISVTGAAGQQPIRAGALLTSEFLRAVALDQHVNARESFCIQALQDCANALLDPAGSLTNNQNAGWLQAPHPLRERRECARVACNTREPKGLTAEERAAMQRAINHELRELAEVCTRAGTASLRATGAGTIANPDGSPMTAAQHDALCRLYRWWRENNGSMTRPSERWDVIAAGGYTGRLGPLNSVVGELTP